MSARRFDLEAAEGEFAFAEATEEKVSFWRSKFPEDRQRSAVIPMLWLAQKDNGGWLSEPAMREVADRLEMPYIRVYEVATFYTMFNLKPVGRFHVQLCGTTPCMLRGANDLKDVCARVIGPKEQVNDSGRLSWVEVECLGACVNAPMVQINDGYYEDLTPESFEEILRKMDNGVEVEPGNFVDRQTSAPEIGAKTLKDDSLFDGSRAEPVQTLPNAPDEMPESNLKARADYSPQGEGGETVKAPTPQTSGPDVGADTPSNVATGDQRASNETATEKAQDDAEASNAKRNDQTDGSSE